MSKRVKNIEYSLGTKYRTKQKFTKQNTTENESGKKKKYMGYDKYKKLSHLCAIHIII